MTLPNFLIIGAAKAGTTSIAHYISQHPDIFVSKIKEPYFFSFEGENLLKCCGPGDQEVLKSAVTELSSYRKLFADVKNESVLGEASVSYLYTPRACERIYNYVPDVKLIAILRNPIEQAYSSFLHQLREGYENTRDFQEALDQEQKRLDIGWMYFWGYKRNGYYSKLLKPYYDKFKPDKIKIFLYEDLISDLQGLIREIFSFLNVDPHFKPELSIRYNVSGIPRNRFLYELIDGGGLIKSGVKSLLSSNVKRLIRKSLLDKPPISKSIKQALLEDYREDIMKLQSLISRDLSSWLC